MSQSMRHHGPPLKKRKSVVFNIFDFPAQISLVPISDYQITQMNLPLCLGGGIPLYPHTYPKDAQKNIVNPGKVAERNRFTLRKTLPSRPRSHRIRRLGVFKKQE